MLRNIFNTFANCFKIPELKSRLLFTFGVLLICRLMAYITIPGLNGEALAKYINEHAQGGFGGLLAMYNTFAGGAYENCAVGALGIMPYISATIILQLMTAVIPQLSKLSREEGGRSKIIQIGRVMTVFLCMGQGLYFAAGWQNPAKQFPGFEGSLVLSPGWWYLVQTVLIMTTGTMLLMWLGEQITERGVGNGVSLIITIGIIARIAHGNPGFERHVRPRSGRRTDAPSDGDGHHAAHFVGGGHRRRDRGHASPAENSGAICPAGRRAQNVCRRHVLHAAARELFRRHADHFRPVHPDVPGAYLPVFWAEISKCRFCRNFSAGWEVN